MTDAELLAAIDDALARARSCWGAETPDLCDCVTMVLSVAHLEAMRERLKDKPQQMQQDPAVRKAYLGSVHERAFSQVSSG